MATITLYASKLNQMPELAQGVRKAITNYRDDISLMRKKALQIDGHICDLRGVVSMLQVSTQIQEEKADTLSALGKKSTQFIKDIAHIDNEVAELVKQRKEDFYGKYAYLKPKREKNGWEKICDGCKKVGEWCKQHWCELLTTIVLIVGAVLAIAMIVCTGGVALVPLFTSVLMAIGISSAIALPIAIALSIGIATVAVISTIASSVLNIIGTWYDMSDNVAFKTWQNVMNWVSLFSNGLYSIGNIYNSIKGVSGKEFIARQKAIANGKIGYSNLDSKHPNMKHRSGGKFDRTRKNEILQENARRNGGVIRSDQTGKPLEGTSKYLYGSKHPMNEVQVDHIISRAQGGSNGFNNAQVIERAANMAKSANKVFSNYMQYSIPDKGSLLKAIGLGLGGQSQAIVNIRFLEKDTE